MPATIPETYRTSTGQIQEETYNTPVRYQITPHEQKPSKAAHIAKVIGKKTLKGLAIAAHEAKEGISKVATTAAHEAKVGLGKAKEMIHEATAPNENETEAPYIVDIKPITY